MIPFISLIFYNTKRNKKILLFFAIWIFIFHYVDMFWLTGPVNHHGAAQFSWMDLTTFLGIGGLFIGLFWNNFTSKAVIPINDPSLEASVNLHE